MVANNCVAPMKEIFTRTPRISQRRFMKAHSGLSEPELASTEVVLVDSWERFGTRMGRLALTKGEGEGEGLVERTFILYDPSPLSSPL